MSNPHPSQRAARMGGSASAKHAAEEREYRFAEADFLLSCGSSPHEVARQLGCTAAALGRQAYRWGRSDLAAIFAAADKGECVDCGEPNHPRRTRCIHCHNRNVATPARMNRLERTAA